MTNKMKKWVNRVGGYTSQVWIKRKEDRARAVRNKEKRQVKLKEKK